jgi:hypothetical protein
MTMTDARGNDFADRLSRRCQEFIDAEVTRLGRREPGLASADLAEIDRVLTDLADKLLLDTLRRRPDLAGRLEPLFVLPR